MVIFEADNNKGAKRRRRRRRKEKRLAHEGRRKIIRRKIFSTDKVLFNDAELVVGRKQQRWPFASFAYPFEAGSSTEEEGVIRFSRSVYSALC